MNQNQFELDSQYEFLEEFKDETYNGKMRIQKGQNDFQEISYYRRVLVLLVLDNVKDQKIVLKKYITDNREVYGDFRRELYKQKQACKIDKNLFCQVYEFKDEALNQNEQKLYKLTIELEYCSEGDLHQLIKNYQKKNKEQQIKQYWPENLIQKLFYDLINAGFILQQENLAHRDIKPQNIFLTNDNKCKLGDFGEVKQLVDKATKEHTLKGTEIFLSPQQYEFKLQGHCVYNPFKSDVFSLGVTLVYVMSLEPPKFFNHKNG